jgi:hypothetical protein
MGEPASFMLSGKPQKNNFLHVPKDCWSFGGLGPLSSSFFFFFFLGGGGAKFFQKKKNLI